MLGKFPRRQPLTITVIAVMIAMVLVLVPGASAKPKSKAIRIAETKRTHDKALAEIQLLRLEAELSTRVAALEMAGVALRANKARGAKLEDVFSHAGALGGGRRLRLQLAQAIGQCTCVPDPLPAPDVPSLSLHLPNHHTSSMSVGFPTRTQPDRSDLFRGHRVPPEPVSPYGSHISGNIVRDGNDWP